jgi:hypothetical protein
MLALGPVPRDARTVVVPANVAWTITRIRVIAGQRLQFEATGEVRLSFDSIDTSTAGGAKTFRISKDGPLPGVPVGALIGRINSGTPFPIGESRQPIRMPETGTLFLGVNDDHVADNSGNLVVKAWTRSELGN